MASPGDVEAEGEVSAS